MNGNWWCDMSEVSGWMMAVPVGVALVGLFLVALVVAWGIRATGQFPSMRGAESAEDILRRRYAAGEIDEEEFTRRRTHLS